jgi:hypothetical protein
MLGGAARRMPNVAPLNLIKSHAYTECGHVAQCFRLSKFGGAQHDTRESGRTRKDVRRAHRRAEDAVKRAFFDVNVRRPLECRTFFPAAV